MVEALTEEERAQLVQDYLAQYAKQLSSEQVARIIADPQSDNTLGLRVLLVDLRQLGVHERLGLVGEALSYIWAAWRVLSEVELLEMLVKGDEPLPHRAWSPLYLALAGGLVDRGSLLDFFHDY